MTPDDKRTTGQQLADTYCAYGEAKELASEIDHALAAERKAAMEECVQLALKYFGPNNAHALVCAIRESAGGGE